MILMGFRTQYSKVWHLGIQYIEYLKLKEFEKIAEIGKSP